MEFNIRALCEKDIDQVSKLDEISGFSLKSMLDSEGYAHGLFLSEELIGYCSLGYADGVIEDCYIKSYASPSLKGEALLLGDVFIVDEHRDKGNASAMISTVLAYDEYKDIPTFAMILDDEISQFYEKLGFKETSCEGLMIKK